MNDGSSKPADQAPQPPVRTQESGFSNNAHANKTGSK